MTLPLHKIRVTTCSAKAELLCFLVQGVLLAETAVLVELKSVGVILLVLLGFVIALLAFAASKSDLNSHFGTS